MSAEKIKASNVNDVECPEISGDEEKFSAVDGQHDFSGIFLEKNMTVSRSLILR